MYFQLKHKIETSCKVMSLAETKNGNITYSGVSIAKTKKKLKKSRELVFL